MEVTDMINMELSNKIEKEFLEIYKKAANGVRNENFNEILDILRREGITLNTGDTLAIFQNNFVENLTESFKKMWLVQNIPQSISVLAILKERCKNRKIPQWRPFGKSVEEQTLPCRIRLLKLKKQFIIKQWEFQRSKLEALVPKIEKCKEHIKTLNNKRDVLSFRIDEQNEKFTDVLCSFEKLHDKALNMLLSPGD